MEFQAPKKPECYSPGRTKSYAEIAENDCFTCLERATCLDFVRDTMELKQFLNLVMNEKLSRNAETLAANNKGLSAMVDTLNSCHLISKGDLLDTQAAASYLGITGPGTIRNWLEGGSFPGAFQSGGQWFFPAVELNKVKHRMDEIQTKNKNRDLQPPDPSDDYDLWAVYD